MIAKAVLQALKTFPCLDPATLYRFKQEFRSLVGVSHANLVTLYELVAESQIWFFTMEYVEGSNFLAYVRSQITEGPTPSPLPAENVGRLRNAIRQLAEGVSALHIAGKTTPRH